MEKEIFKYLEFLLPIHNCVTIPDFGGFIVNAKSPLFSTNDEKHPQYGIVFNPDLNHNDGIIASYISKDENISYNAACNKIRDFVKALQIELKSGKAVICGNIGILTINYLGNTTFSSNKNIIYPAFYGLGPIGIKQLSDVNDAIRKKKRNISIKYALGGMVAAIAAISLFTTSSTNIKDENYAIFSKASFISSIATPLSQPNIAKEVPFESGNKNDNTFITSTESESLNTAVRTYYIIIGGEENKTRAERLLKRIKEADFPDAAMIETQDRYRIYISSFEDKREAEDYLSLFRKDNPKYQTAWLYSKRSK
ncbi:MAG: SPOR domain-containing protein [Dysgonomonas sp.]